MAKPSFTFLNNKINITLRNFYAAPIKCKIIGRLPIDISPSDITWNWALETFHSCCSEEEMTAFVYIYLHLISNDCIAKDCHYTILSKLNSGIFHTKLYRLLTESLAPTNLIIVRAKKNFRYFFTDANSTILYDLLEQLAFEHTSECAMTLEFLQYFTASLGSSVIYSINDFNFKKFEKQYKYFIQTFPQNKTNIERLLKSFYILLYNNGCDVFKYSNIDINLFSNLNFFFWYSNGYTLIHCNPYDPVPSSDNWVLAPGNLVSESTKLNRSKYITVNFSDIKDLDTRYIVKNWYWHTNICIVSRNELLYVIKEFISYIGKLRCKLNTLSCSLFVSPEEIFMYSRYIVLKNQNAKLNRIKNFLKYIEGAKLAPIDNSCYMYLKGKKQSVINTATDIPDNDLVNLENKLKSNQCISMRYNLYYIVFHIALATELRISSILNLKKDCLIYDESSKVYIKTNTKTSKGKEITIIIPTRIQRLLEAAITITNPLREGSVNKDVTDYLFIYSETQRGPKHMITRTFSEYLKSMCQAINIPEYTATNLRDTYMTKVVAMSINSGKSLLEIKSLTLHQVMTTTSKHYVSEKIRDYLETTYMTKIGDVDIKGTIVKDTDGSITAENLVQDSCGYCKKYNCDVFNGIDCLICDGFIATLDRIPYFEEAISKIAKQIIESPLQHDKEHLLVIKRLYMAFLERLYILMEEEK